MVKLYVVHPMTYGRGFCKCRMLKGGGSPLLLLGNEPNALLSGSGAKPDLTKVRSVLSGLNARKPHKKYINI